MTDAMPTRSYTISGVTDFDRVPDDRIAACLAEFAPWVEMRRTARLFAGRNVELSAEFVWIDDGKDDCTLVFVHAETGKKFASLTRSVGGSQP